MVTGAISLRAPEYSPTWAGWRSVRASSSSRHCRAARVEVTRTRVRAPTAAMAPRPTRVLPAPQGSTITPDPAAAKAATDSRW